MYEIKITYLAEKNGKEKIVKENLILEHAESFSDAEEIGYEYASGLKAVDVTDIKRSRIKEVLNARQSQEDLIWQAELLDVFHDEDDKETQLKYKVVLFAPTFDRAKSFIVEYMKQGYDMTLISIQLTNFLDVLI